MTLLHSMQVKNIRLALLTKKSSKKHSVCLWVAIWIAASLPVQRVHGPSGLGMGLAAFPLLSGQHAEYTALTLKEFRSGDRSNDPNGMMRDIAARLTDRDIEILSKYIRGLY